MARTLQIAIIANEWPPVTGGAGKALAGMVAGSESLCKEFDVSLVVVAPGPARREEFHSRAYGLFFDIGKHLKKRGRFRYWSTWRWRHVLKHLELKPDLWHIWQPLPSIYWVRQPHIITFHGSDVPGRNYTYHDLYRVFGNSYWRHCRQACAWTAVTSALATRAMKWLDRDVRHIPNGVTVPHDMDRVLHRPLRLLAVTRIEPLKNVHELVQMAGLMQGEAVLRIVGDGRDLEVYHQCGLRNIEWVGWQNDLDEHYRWADIFVSSASATGPGVALMEAKSYSLPAVARMFPGCDDIPGIYPCGYEGMSYVRAVRYVAERYMDALWQASKGIYDLDWSVRGREYFNLYRSL